MNIPSFKIANQLKKEGRLSEAVAIYDRLIEMNPNFSWYHHQLGEALLAIKDKKRAAKAFNRAIEINANYAHSYYCLGQIFFDLGNIEGAETYYKKAIEIDPDFYNFYNSLGKVSVKLGKPDMAMIMYQKAIEINPQSARAYSSLGELLKQQARWDEAAANYQKALELKNNFQDYHDLGFIFLRQRKLDEAVAAFGNSINLNPNFFWSHHHLGNALRDQRKLDLAVMAYRRAIALNPNFFTSHRNMADVLEKQARLDEAVAEYQILISLQPNYAPGYYQLGAILKKQGKLDEAIAYYNRAISLNPDDGKSYWHLGVTLYEKGQLEEAIVYVQKALKLNSNLVNRDEKNYLGFILSQKAKLMIQQDKLEEAIATCKTVIRDLDSQHAISLKLLGDIYEKQGKLAEAENYYERASVCADFSAESHTMLIFFRSRFGGQGGSFKFEFVKVSNELQAKKMFIRDLHSAWYNKGLPGIAKNIDEIAAYIQNQIESQNARKVILFGVSAGGYVALLIGWLLEVSQAHAFNPQTIIPNGPSEEVSLRNIDPKYFNLQNVFMSKPSIKTELNIYFDNLYERDTNHARRLSCFENVKLRGYPAGVGHRIAGWLNSNGALKDIITNAINS